MAAAYLGVDGGESGGAVVYDRDAKAVVWWAAWTPAPDGVAVVGTDGRDVLPCHGSLGGLVLPPLAGAAIEAVFVGPAAQKVVGLAEVAGVWRGLVARHGIVPERPMASRWRADLLRLPPSTRAAQADRYAAQTVRHLGLYAPGMTPHVVDAVCIALWAAGVRGGVR